MGNLLGMQIPYAFDDLCEKLACIFLIKVAMLLQSFEKLAALTITI